MDDRFFQRIVVIQAMRKGSIGNNGAGGASSESLPINGLCSGPPSLCATFSAMRPKSIVDDASAIPIVSRNTSLALATTGRRNFVVVSNQYKFPCNPAE